MNRSKELVEIIGKRFLISDGGFGSMLQKHGIKTGDAGLNINNPEAVIRIHEAYLNCGSQIVTTNTFGIDRIHLEGSEYSVKQVIAAAITNAKQAITNTSKDAFIMYDMSSTGKLLKPLGDLDFDEAYEVFKELVDFAKNDVDGFFIETFSDLYEMKAAILAIKENCNLPVIASATFSSNGKMLTGASPIQVVTMLENLGVDMLAVNCSLGPKELLPIVDQILSVATLPFLVQPNAGLPRFDGVNTYYEIDPIEFASYIGQMIDMGIAGFGGCCGTTPEHIKACIEESYKHEFSYSPKNNATRVTGTMKCVEIGNRVICCGERLNPTGKPKMKLALAEGRLDDIVTEGIKQIEAGAKVLDVNVGIPNIDEPQILTDLIIKLQELIDVPLQIDSSDPVALDRACRIYNGIPLVNSVNGKKEVMDSVFPIVKKYGGVVIGLCIDDKGIPPTSDERFEIAKSIVKEAQKYGIPSHRIIIDSLVLTASAQQKEAIETIKCVSMVTKELGLGTTLGLSNVSFGLPNRPLINRTFLAMAMQAGLKLPIMNPFDRELMGTIDAYEVLGNFDEGASSYIENHKDDVSTVASSSKSISSTSDNSNDDSNSASVLFDAIVKGQKTLAVETVKQMKDIAPLDVVSLHMIPALDKVGADYDSGKIFLPQLMMSAETAKLVFDVLKENIDSGNDNKKGPIILATVEGDVHDIGKNIVKVVLQSYGFEVVDLGKDIKASEIYDAVVNYNPIAVGLSALMTTTVVYMRKTIELLRNKGIKIPVIVGGAVLSQDVCDQIGGDYYGKDAMETVRIAETIYNKIDRK